MKPNDLQAELSKIFPANLAADLVAQFVNLANEVRASALERVSGGKFVETTVQCLQFLDSGTYQTKPDVDAYLRGLENGAAGAKLPDDLRLTLQRIARSAYTIRNKRNVAHKGEVDPNIYDLRFIYAAAQWILTEFVRHAAKIEVAIAGRMIDFLQIPASAVVDNVGGTRIVHGVEKLDDELLVLMNSYYPDATNWSILVASLTRRSTGSVANALRRLHTAKLIHKDGATKEYWLTSAGYKHAQKILAAL